MIWITRKSNTARYHLFQYDFSFCIILFCHSERSEESAGQIYKSQRRFLTMFRITLFYLLNILPPVIRNQIRKQPVCTRHTGR